MFAFIDFCERYSLLNLLKIF